MKDDVLFESGTVKRQHGEEGVLPQLRQLRHVDGGDLYDTRGQKERLETVPKPHLTAII